MRCKSPRCGCTLLIPCRRKRSSRTQDKRQELLFILLRWPLLVSCSIMMVMLCGIYVSPQLLIFLFIGIEFGLYVLIRQLVNTKEWLSACENPTSKYIIHLAEILPGRGRKGVLRRRLRNATTYQVCPSWCLWRFCRPR